MFTIKSSGSFENTENFFKAMLGLDISSELHRYGREGVAALAANTPADSGLSAESWGYEVKRTGRGSYSIAWTNSNVTAQGTPVVILLQYGHGTGTGGFVRGQDFINPAIQPIFDKISEGVWKAVKSA